jgi:hypothetical protein
MKPVCVPCERFMRMKKSGFYFLEGRPTVQSAKPGLENPELWVPYKLWAGDLWYCPTCKTEIVAGFGAKPMSEDYLPSFAELVKLLAVKFLVKDC